MGRIINYLIDLGLLLFIRPLMAHDRTGIHSLTKSPEDLTGSDFSTMGIGNTGGCPINILDFPWNGGGGLGQNSTTLLSILNSIMTSSYLVLYSKECVWFYLVRCKYKKEARE